MGNGFLHKIGKFILCKNCEVELRDALGFNIVKEKAQNPEVENHTKYIFV